jgi:cbb3-type cytochrome oxidase subunit 3
MKIDQNTLFIILFLIAMWLLFFRQKKTEKYCAACAGMMA